MASGGPPVRTVPAPTLAELIAEAAMAREGLDAARERYIRTEAQADLDTVDLWVKAARKANTGLAIAYGLLERQGKDGDRGRDGAGTTDARLHADRT